MFAKHATFLTIGLMPFLASAQEIERVAVGAASDLANALSELAAVRQQVEEERTAAARQLNELEQRLTTTRTDYAKAQRLQENQLVELNALKTEAKRQADEAKYIDSLLTEYARSFRSRLSFIEEPRYQGMLESFEKAGTASDLDSTRRSNLRFDLLIGALKRTEAALGGEVFKGKALDKQGLVRSGKVALVGPVAVFASASGQSVGLLQQELNKSDPTVMPVDAKLEKPVAALVANGNGQLPLDPTLGNAFKLSALHESFYEKLEKGGLMMIPLIGLGVLAVLMALAKWYQLARVRLASEEDLQEVLTQLEVGERERAHQRAGAISGLAGELLTAGIENAEEKKEHIEEILYEKLLGARIQLERGIAFLALTATTGPLMGLLGTVMGMISTFKLISSFGSGDPKLLAAGISEALICTATGMAVAIPALLFHAFLSRKAKGIIGSLEKTSVGFVNGLPEKDKPLFA